MAHHPMWRRDSAKPAQSDPIQDENVPLAAIPSGASGSDKSSLEGDKSGAAGQESEFAQLAAKFAAHGGGRIPAELSGELALDIVLNEIVEQACLATGATGAAIALARGEEMVCRASSGGNAPELGTRLDTNSGLSGACLRSRQIECCDDALTDPRADAEISRQLGVRSVVVVPLLRDQDSQEQELIGIFEIFSARPAAFGDRDLRTLEALAGRILKNAEARQSALVSIGLASTSFVSGTPQEEAGEEIREMEEKAEGAPERPGGGTAAYESPAAQSEPETTHANGMGARRFDWLTTVMSGIVVAVVLLMTMVFAMRVGWLKASRQHRKPRAASASQATPAARQTDAKPGMQAAEPMTPPKGQDKSTTGQPATRTENARGSEGGLRVYENGKEIFRMPSSESAATGTVPAEKGTSTGSALQPARIVELSADAAEGSLVRRVEPKYPEQALAQRIQGPVLLDVRISEEGTVQEIKLVSGDAQLAEAAIAAVRQWRFQPQRVNGHAVEMETKITLKFTLPPS